MLIKYNDNLTLKKYKGCFARDIAISDPQYFIWLAINTRHTFDVQLNNAITTNFCGNKITNETSITLWKEPRQGASYKGEYPCKIKVYDWVYIHETAIKITGTNGHWYNISEGELASHPILKKPLLPNDMTFLYDQNNLPFKIGDSFTFNNEPRGNIIAIVKENDKEVRLDYEQSNGKESHSYWKISNYKKFKFFSNGESQKTTTNEVHRSFDDDREGQDKGRNLFPSIGEKSRVQEIVFPSKSGFGNHESFFV